VCVSVLQCVAACCSVLQRGANYSSRIETHMRSRRYSSSARLLQCVAVCCSVLQRVAACCSAVPYTGLESRRACARGDTAAAPGCCSVLQYVAVRKCVALYCGANYSSRIETRMCSRRYSSSTRLLQCVELC